MKTVKVYDSFRPSNRSGSIQLVEGLMVLVHTIRDSEVLFVTQPHLQDYQDTSTSHTIDFESIDETRFLRLSRDSAPIRITASDQVYEISVDSIGDEIVDGRRTNFCVFVVREFNSR